MLFLRVWVKQKIVLSSDLFEYNLMPWTKAPNLHHAPGLFLTEKIAHSVHSYLWVEWGDVAELDLLHACEHFVLAISHGLILGKHIEWEKVIISTAVYSRVEQ